MSRRFPVVAALCLATAACTPPGPTPGAFVGPQPNTANAAPAPGSPGAQPGATAPGPSDPYGAPPATGELGSLDRYSYVTPAGWTEQRDATHIALRGPDCVLQIIAPAPAQASLEEMLDAAWAHYYAGHQFRYGATYETVVHGTSAAGLRYRRLEAELVSANQQQAFKALAFGVDLGGEVALVFGVSGLGSRCFLDRWGIFQDSLRFAGTSERDDAFRDAIIGTWSSAGGAGGLSLTFAGNGRYDAVSLSQQDSRISDTHVLRTTKTFQGVGAWTLHGRHLVTRSDHGAESTYRIRVEIEETARGREELLCRITTDAGGEYESCMRRSPQ